MLREQQQPACVTAYTEALELCQRIGNHQGEAIAASNLGIAYHTVPGLLDLDLADRWLHHALDCYDPADQLRRAGATVTLGGVALVRFRGARAAGRPEAELLGYLNAALIAFQQALDTCPRNAVGDLGAIDHNLGRVSRWAGQLDAAMAHYRESIRFGEAAGDRYGAATTRLNVGVLLAEHRRLDEAQLWAQAEFDGFYAVGPGAAEIRAETEQLLARIEQARASETSTQS